MGYNRVLLTLNDFDHEADRDPTAFRNQCNEAFIRLQRKRWDPNHPKQPERYLAVEAIWEEHADNTALIMCGGNTATVLGSVHNGGVHRTPEDQLRVLKAVLSRMGYNVVKKRTRNSKAHSDPA